MDLVLVDNDEEVSPVSSTLNTFHSTGDRDNTPAIDHTNTKPLFNHDPVVVVSMALSMPVGPSF
ncbi:hypothetical protein HK100_010296 [Physocladia obscura]|uniref:Uncharacterized protein n=1 Tax=Physocladia obscura TaxID=109957 RepID=A0AAD5SLB5_9FUNG|nr:hypothetical protein HK100_010296 [Physocladia obscura]